MVVGIVRISLVLIPLSPYKDTSEADNISIADTLDERLCTTMTTSIFKGRVYHARTQCVSSTINHRFEYPVWMALVDLQQIEETPESLPAPTFLCSFSQTSSAPALAKWRRKDHFGTRNKLSEDVKELVRTRTQGAVEVSRVELLTNMSFFGRYNFNPVSIYYCYSEMSKLVAVVLEVSNTPWLDKRLYVLEFSQPDHSYRMCWEKDFHVSPFMDASHYYDWILRPLEGDKLRVEAISKRKAVQEALVPWQGPHVNGDAPITAVDSKFIRDLPTSFIVKVELERVPWARVSRTILTNPVMPLAAVLWIHIEAFRVWYRGVGYVLPPIGSRLLDLKDAAVHLVVFFIAAVVRYGVILPIDLLRRLIRKLLSLPSST